MVLAALWIAPNPQFIFRTTGPVIASLSQTSGAVGATVTITGSLFGLSQGSSTVTFNGVGATASAWSPTSITVTVPGGATSGNVLVTVGPRASNGIAFTVTSGSCTVTISSGGSVANALNGISSGGTVCLNAGTYGYASSIVKTSQTTVTPSSGVSQSQVTLTSFDTGSSQFLKFDNMTIAGGDVQSGSRNIEIARIRFTGSLCIQAAANNMAILVTRSTFINLPSGCTEGRLGVRGQNSGTNGVVISYNEFSGPDGDAIQVTNNASGTVIGPGNYFHDVTGCSVHCDGIQPFAAQNTTVTGNYFKNMDGIIADFDCNGSPLTFTNNVVDQGAGSAQNAVAMSGTNGNIVTHNTFSNTTELQVYGGNPGNCQNTNFLSRDNVFKDGVTVVNCTSNCVQTNNFTTSTFVGGTNPTTAAGFVLTAGSPGKGAATDGGDVGATFFGPYGP